MFESNLFGGIYKSFKFNVLCFSVLIGVFVAVWLPQGDFYVKYEESLKVEMEGEG